MEVLNEFQQAIEIASKDNLIEFEEQMRLPLDERVTKGITMANLKVKFKFHQGLPNEYCYLLPSSQKYIHSAEISCDNNISKFKEGSSVLLSNGVHKFEMEIEEDSNQNFILKPNDFNVKNCYINTNDYPNNNW